MQEEIKAQEETQANTELTINKKIKNLLTEIARWAKFVGVAGFCATGFLLIFSVVIVFFGEALSQQLSAEGQTGVILNQASGLAYMIVAVLYYFVSKRIYDFAVFLQQAVAYNDQESLDYSLDRLRGFFKFIANVIIVVIFFYLIVFVSSLFMGK
ncbi:hypothetical protein [Pelobium manganitolerans]|uniref:hypothetical protein n=1 Tax=Pelobium manganitolerans TaxID=1842495 RepID=UPI003FA3A1CC